MPASLKFQLVQEDNGLWGASVVLKGRVMHLGYFWDKTEAQRALDLALAHYGDRPAGG